jgi:hypothetical protein
MKENYDENKTQIFIYIKSLTQVPTRFNWIAYSIKIMNMDGKTLRYNNRVMIKESSEYFQRDK